LEGDVVIRLSTGITEGGAPSSPSAAPGSGARRYSWDPHHGASVGILAAIPAKPPPTGHAARHEAIRRAPLLRIAQRCSYLRWYKWYSANQVR